MQPSKRMPAHRSNSFESFTSAKQQQQILRNRRASISHPDLNRQRSPSICLSDDSWVYSPQQVDWVDESKISNCRGCLQDFSMIIRKHHCRNCGDVFCGTCSSFRIKLPGYDDRQRVCLHCVTRLAADRAPPRSPDSPSRPSEAAVNGALPDDLDDLFAEIIQDTDGAEDCPSSRPAVRRSLSAASRPPRKLFSSTLPVPSSGSGSRGRC
jgi:hypothetical protein